MADDQQHPGERRDDPAPRPRDDGDDQPPPPGREEYLDDLLDEDEDVERRRGLVTPARVWAALAGAFLLGALIAALVSLLGGSSVDDGDRVAFTELVGMDSAVEDTEVELLEGDDGRTLRFFPAEMPDVADGYAQVWLVDSQGSRQVPVGVLEEGRTDVTVPATLELSGYPVVEVSLESYDGDPSHSGRTLWRGELTTPAS